MTNNKALLTVKDVENFIYNTILEYKMDGVLTRKQLKARLQISEWELDGYIAKGLPWFGKEMRKKFNLNEVKSWMFKNNIPIRNHD